MSFSPPLVAPLFPAGREPLPPGFTEEDRAQLVQAKKYQGLMAMAMESCPVKTAIAGVGGKCPPFGRADAVTPKFIIRIIPQVSALALSFHSCLPLLHTRIHYYGKTLKQA